MTRAEGFIEVDKMLNHIGISDVNMSNLTQESRIHMITNVGSKKLFSFNYAEKTYFYKYGKYNSPYNELVAEELAKDFGINCITYDLAVLNGLKGVISVNYKKENANYISGADLLYKCYGNTNKNLEVYNNLMGLWNALEYYYNEYPNKDEIVFSLMKKIVDMFIFDIITCQYDRHSENWEIIEAEGKIDIAPLYDNEGILKTSGKSSYVSITMEEEEYNTILKVLEDFQRVSSEEFSSIIENKLWIISEKNLKSIFVRIEQKTGYSMPTMYKNYYLEEYRKHQGILKRVLERNRNLRRR